MGLGKMDEAQSDYEAVVDSGQPNVIALNNLAWIYAESDLAKALEVSKAAYELAGQVPDVMDTYGWFLVENKKYQEGLEILGKALELAPDNDEIRSHYEQAKVKGG